MVLRIITVVALFLGVTAGTHAQTDVADSLLQLAIDRMESSPDDAIFLLDRAARLAPGNTAIAYEKAYALSLKKEHARSVAILLPLLADTAASDIYFQLTGAELARQGLLDSGRAIYRRGLSRHPRSGWLRLGMGNLEEQAGQPSEAIGQYELGMLADPELAANYYRAALLFLRSDEPVWGIIYGETFINLEPDLRSPRVAQMGRLLFQAYQRGISRDAEGRRQVRFSRRATAPAAGDSAMPSPAAALRRVELLHDLTILQSIVVADGCADSLITLRCLSNLRGEFVRQWFAQGRDKMRPSALMDHLKLLQDLGMLEAYTYGLLGNGSIEEVNAWLEDHDGEFAKYLQWRAVNRLRVGDRPLVRE